MQNPVSALVSVVVSLLGATFLYFLTKNIRLNKVRLHVVHL